MPNSPRKEKKNIREGERKRAVERERKAKKRSLYFIPIFFSLRYEIGETNEIVVVMTYDVVDIMVVVVVGDMVCVTPQLLNHNERTKKGYNPRYDGYLGANFEVENDGICG